VGTRAFFRAFALARPEQKREWNAKKKKAGKKRKRRERKKKKVTSRFFYLLPHNAGNPVLDLKATRQLESKRLE
jgi:hypothetical protein